MEIDDLVNEIPSFERQQADRCLELGIDVTEMPLSHLAVRFRTWNDYVSARNELERRSIGNHENVWNGRPISKLMLADPIVFADGRSVALIELIPPFHQRVYKMGLEHVGYVVETAQFDNFSATHYSALTGQQFQSKYCKPVYILFPDYTHVKFYPVSLRDACLLEGATFKGIHHADWMPEDPTAGPYEIG